MPFPSDSGCRIPHPHPTQVQTPSPPLKEPGIVASFCLCDQNLCENKLKILSGVFSLRWHSPRTVVEKGSTPRPRGQEAKGGKLDGKGEDCPRARPQQATSSMEALPPTFPHPQYGHVMSSSED